MPNNNSSLHFFDGKSIMPLDQFISIIGGEKAQGSQKLVKLYATVSWLYRGVQLRENGVSSMPFEIRRGDNVVYEFDPNSGKQDQPPAGLEILTDIPHLSGMVEGAAILRGKAYVYNVRNRAKTLELRWLLPDSIKPEFDDMGKVSSFVRDRNGREQKLEVDDIVYFWPPDKFVETGPAKNYPGIAAMAAANVLHSADDFLKGYFERGLVKATLLKYRDSISPDEASRVREWWRRVFTGTKNAFASEVVRGDFETIEIGDGLSELQNTALTTEERESIATALGIPQSKMTQPPGGLGDTKTPDDLMFVTDTVIPACTWIQRAWNRRYFLPRGYMLVYTPQKLQIMQEDENKRSVAFRNYVGDGKGSGIPIETVIEILGIHVPDGMPIEQERAQIPPALAENMGQPSEDDTPGETEPQKSIDYLELVDKRDERNRFWRWLDNRKGKSIDIANFECLYFDDYEKGLIYQEWQNEVEMSELIGNYARVMSAENSD